MQSQKVVHFRKDPIKTRGQLLEKFNLSEDDLIEVEHKPSYPKKAPIHLEYELSSEQKDLSDKLVENYKKGIDSLVFAVCGSLKIRNT